MKNFASIWPAPAQPNELTAYAGMALLVMAIASIASLFPAWRAVRINPTTALRYE